MESESSDSTRHYWDRAAETFDQEPDLVLIEGQWHTGVGLQVTQTVAALPAACAMISVKELSGLANLWGGAVTDERYVVVADLPESAVNVKQKGRTGR